MNIAQKIIVSVALIIMGAWSLLFSYHLTTESYQAEDILSVFISLLGVAFVAAGLVILSSLKIRK